MSTVRCPSCGKRFKVAADHDGRRLYCPYCHAALSIRGRGAGAEGEIESEAVAVPAAGAAGAGAGALEPPLAVVTPGAVPLESIDEDESRSGHDLPKVAMAMGVAGLAIPGLDLAAVVLGVIGLSRLSESEAHDAPRRNAYVAIVLGVVGFLLKLLALIVAIVLMLWAPRSMQQAQSPQPTPTPPAAAAASVEETPSPPPSPPTPPQAAAPPPKRTGQAWYFDLNSGQLFTGKKDQIAPIEAPSGPLPDGGKAGVKAFVFSCGDCADPQERFVAWIERHTPNAKKVRERSLQGNPMDAAYDLNVDELIDMLAAPVQISVDGGETWQGMHPVTYGQWQLQKINGMCPQGQAKPCSP